MWQASDQTKRSRRLRRKSTLAESVFWNHVRDRRLDGLKFRRQSPVAGSVCDFVCLELKLVIELDGGVHRLKEAQDGLRDAKLRAAGFTVLRSANEAFLSDPNALLFAIRRYAATTAPSPLGGEGGSRSKTDEGAAGCGFSVQSSGIVEPTPSSGPSGHLLPRGEKDHRLV